MIIYNLQHKLDLLKASPSLGIFAGAAYSPVATESEDRRANLCDSGLPDGDVCNVLLTPSVKKDILEEAWARGYSPHYCCTSPSISSTWNLRCSQVCLYFRVQSSDNSCLQEVALRSACGPKHVLCYFGALSAVDQGSQLCKTHRVICQ